MLPPEEKREEFRRMRLFINDKLLGEGEAHVLPLTPEQQAAFEERRRRAMDAINERTYGKLGAYIRENPPSIAALKFNEFSRLLEELANPTGSYRIPASTYPLTEDFTSAPAPELAQALAHALGHLGAAAIDVPWRRAGERASCCERELKLQRFGSYSAARCVRCGAYHWREERP